MDSILSLIYKNTAERPDALCLADGRGSMTYFQYRRRIEGCCAALRERGLKMGGRVVLKCTQDTDFLAALHGIQLSGGVPVPVEKGCSQARIDAIAAQTQADFVLDPHELSGLVGDVDMSLPRPEDLSLILFTTGTTGASKGIALRHAADVAVAENIYFAVGMKPQNLELSPMPLNHSAGLRRYFSAMLSGGAFVIIDGLLVIRRFFDALDTYHANSIAASPTSLPLIFKLTGERLSQYAHQLTFMSFGSAPFPDADKVRLKALLPQTRIYDLYGSTEAGVSCVSEVTGPEAAPKCIGRPTKNARVRILDANGYDKTATADDPGTLAWGGDMCMDGYWNEPVLTAKTYSSGYVHTSDLGYMDETGRIFLLGRADDVMNIGGLKIAPDEVEDAARAFPGVRDCVCVGVRDKAGNEILGLYYEGQELDAVKLRAFLRERMEPYKVPGQIIYMPLLPRTYNGKLDRKALRFEK